MKFSLRQLSELLSDQVKQQIIHEHGRTDEDLTFLSNKEYLVTLWGRLSSDEQEVIRFFLIHKGSDFLTYREIEQGADLPLSLTSFRIAVIKLRRLGILFTLRRQWGEVAYVIPQEILTGYRQQFVAPVDSWERPHTLPVSISYHMLDELFQVVNDVRKKPLTLTKKGTVHKKDLKAMLDRIGWNKQRFAYFDYRHPISHPYDPDEAILLDLLSNWGLLMENEGQAEIGDMSLWLNKSSMELRRQCCEYLLEYMDTNPRLEFFWDIIKQLETHGSYSLRSILASMGEYAPSFQQAKEQFLVVFSSLGFISLMDQEEDVLWNWRDMKEISEPTVYVQPNFEIWIPAFSSWKMKWTLGSFAHLVKREEMWSYKMDKDSVQFFFEKGKTGEELLSWLRTCSSFPLPENIIQSIIEWEQEFRQITFMDARVLWTRNVEMAKELESIPAISQSLQFKLGEGAYVVRIKDWDLLVKELDKRGISPGPVQQWIAVERKDVPVPFLVHKLQPLTAEFKVESVFPDIEDVVPGLRQIPRIWISHYSSYHGSTLRDLIQKAVQMGLELRVEWQGSTLRLQPQDLQNRNGYWFVEAKNQHNKTDSYRLDDIGKIQILLPL